jgi:Major intrinsic protein
MGERLAVGNVAIALLANTIATSAALVALILAFGPISGAHFNPAVTLADALERGVSWTVAACYIPTQCLGAIGGAIAAHAMFALPAVSISTHARSGPAQTFSEFVATFGLLSVIWGVARQRSEMVPFAVGAYITAAYWFTASTSFANPAVTIARCLTVLRHPPRRRPPLHRRPTRRRRRSHSRLPLACPASHTGKASRRIKKEARTNRPARACSPLRPHPRGTRLRRHPFSAKFWNTASTGIEAHAAPSRPASSHALPSCRIRADD